MSNYSNCALHVIGSKIALDNQQTDIIEGFLRVLREDLPSFEAFRATRVNDEYLRLCFDASESGVHSIRPPLSDLSAVSAGEACVFLLTSSSESYCWNDCAATVHVLRDDGAERPSDLARVSPDQYAEAVKRFAAILVAPRQAEDLPNSYEIDCTAMAEGAKQLRPKKATRDVLRARPDALDDLDIL
jgi:hypothetical protein